MRHLAGFFLVATFGSNVAVAKNLDNGCESVRLEQVPANARASLVEQADGKLTNVCRLKRAGAISYRAHGRESGITVEVLADGVVLWRHWSGS
jgi:hypothetical protein